MTKRWAEAYVVFTHARLRAQKIFLSEDAIEVAFWEPQPAASAVVETVVKDEDDVANAALVATASAALEQVFHSDDTLQESKVVVGDSATGAVFEFDPELELEDFEENLLDDVQDDDARVDSILGDFSSNADSRSSATSVTPSVKGSKGEGGEKKKSKKSTSSVAESTTSTKDAAKKEKAEKKKKCSPSSLAESVMSTKSGKGEKSKEKKPAKPKVKKEPEPEKTWAFVRMETVSV